VIGGGLSSPGVSMYFMGLASLLRVSLALLVDFALQLSVISAPRLCADIVFFLFSL
jgi:hypothetical protein